MKIIFLTTVQFSGTRFLNYSIINAIQPDFARMQVANVKGFYRIADTLESKLIHTNTGNIKELIAGIKERFSKIDIDNFTGIVTAHVGSHRGFIPFPDQEKIIDEFPTAVTLRDPLLSLLSREGRSDAKSLDNHYYLVGGFICLAKTTRRIFHVPVDLYARKTIRERVDLLEHLFQWLEVIPATQDYIKKTAQEWKIRGNTQNDNSVPPSCQIRAARLKDWYQSGDLKKIMEVIPNCYRYLKSKESIIRPMLERAGYTNLIWWD